MSSLWIVSSDPTEPRPARAVRDSARAGAQGRGRSGCSTHPCRGCSSHSSPSPCPCPSLAPAAGAGAGAGGCQPPPSRSDLLNKTRPYNVITTNVSMTRLAPSRRISVRVVEGRAPAGQISCYRCSILDYRRNHVSESPVKLTKHQ